MKNHVKTRQQMAEEYGVSVRTLARWINEKNLELGKGLLTPIDQELIYKAFGSPTEKI
ncbi:hypothetical protein JYB64_18290 [Algoriphagus aestuarii]|nr:hypothetical protein [Algoriphagus aestuarii]